MLKEYTPEETRALMEYVESYEQYPESFMDFYIEERRYEYREEWIIYLDEWN